MQSGPSRATPFAHRTRPEPMSVAFLRTSSAHFPQPERTVKRAARAPPCSSSLRRRKVVPMRRTPYVRAQVGGETGSPSKKLPRTASSTNFLCSDIQRAITDNYLIGRHPHVSRTVEIGRNNAVLRHARLCKCSVRLVGKPAEKAKKILKTELDVQCNLRSCNLQ